MVAMETMGLQHRTQLQFICEKDAAARRLTLSHVCPSIVYEDIPPALLGVCLSAMCMHQGFLVSLGPQQGSPGVHMIGKDVAASSPTFTIISA